MPERLKKDLKRALGKKLRITQARRMRSMVPGGHLVIVGGQIGSGLHTVMATREYSGGDALETTSYSTPDAARGRKTLDTLRRALHGGRMPDLEYVKRAATGRLVFHEYYEDHDAVAEAEKVIAGMPGFVRMIRRDQPKR